MLHVASQRWKAMSASERLGFELLAEADMDRYDKELAAFQEQQQKPSSRSLHRSPSAFSSPREGKVQSGI